LVNVAGKSVPPRPCFNDMNLEYWDMVMDRNLRTAVHCCKAVLPGMLRQNYGKIVNLGSTTGLIGVYRYCTAYAASKAALAAFGKALALEVGEFNINVNTILPSDIDTGDVPWRPGDSPRDLGLFTPLLAPSIPRPVRSEEVAELALFLAGDEARAITGAEYLIDVGVTTVEGFPAGPQY
jgi:3-oxoacyl-[acyl-carrier protein] reductase